jgi:hypothetical protein
VGGRAARRQPLIDPARPTAIAEHVMKRFWQSGARAYLVTGYGPASYPDPLQTCKP